MLSPLPSPGGPGIEGCWSQGLGTPRGDTLVSVPPCPPQCLLHRSSPTPGQGCFTRYRELGQFRSQPRGELRARSAPQLIKHMTFPAGKKNLKKLKIIIQGLFLTLGGFTFCFCHSPLNDSQSWDGRRRIDIQPGSFRDIGLIFLLEPGVKISIFPRLRKACSG